MRVEAHYPSGRFVTADAFDLVEAVDLAESQIELGAVLANVLDDRRVLVATVDVDCSEVTYYNDEV